MQIIFCIFCFDIFDEIYSFLKYVFLDNLSVKINIINKHQLFQSFFYDIFRGMKQKLAFDC